MSQTFTVRRKPSWYKDWRVVFQGDFDKAKAKYDKIALNLRQGIVELLDADNVRIDVTSGPMVRTRW